MKETIKGLTEKLKAVEKEYDIKFDHAFKTPEYLEALKELDKAKAHARSILAESKERILGDLSREIEEYEDKIAELKEHNSQKALQRQVNVCKSALEFVEKMQSGGVDHGAPMKVRWATDDGRFIVITTPGHNYWSSVLEPSAYAKASHVMIDTHKNPDSYLPMAHNERLVEGCSVVGRLTKEVLESWKKIAVGAIEGSPSK